MTGSERIRMVKTQPGCFEPGCELKSFVLMLSDPPDSLIEEMTPNHTSKKKITPMKPYWHRVAD